MPNFYELFEKADWQDIQYEGQTVKRIDQFPVSDGARLIAEIESTNSEVRQGFFLEMVGTCELDGKPLNMEKGVKVLVWEDTVRKQLEITVHTDQPFIWVENIWQHPEQAGTSAYDYATFGAAMIVEELPDGRRYRCNDWQPDDDFDDIVFTIRCVDPT